MTPDLITRTLDELGIPRSYCANKGMPVYEEAVMLVPVGPGVTGRVEWLRPTAAAGWRRMQTAAAARGITLGIISAFRSIEQQRQIFRSKLAAGQTIDRILTVNAPPGYSQHHSGNAVDLATPGCALLTRDFERTDAFAWLTRHAAAFGFSLTYPKRNRYGIIYEPWHWAFTDHDAITKGPT